MALVTCPSPADLERLFLGGLPENEVQALEQHVLACAACLGHLKKQLDARETLAEVLREDTPSESSASSPVLEALMNKLQALRAEASKQSEGTQGVASPDQGHDPSLTEFLAPRQTPEELGRLGKYRILQV